ncbi:MAG: hypothetical protein HYV27_15130 [Candidatus Hydrogenedentes bacterium]|nr:hypothetical protein [Candidatus Hydrogenedentota bacterium]
MKVLDWFRGGKRDRKDWYAEALYMKRLYREAVMMVARYKHRVVVLEVLLGEARRANARQAERLLALRRVVDRMHVLWHAKLDSTNPSVHWRSEDTRALSYAQACTLEQCCEALYEALGIPLECEPGDPCPVSMRLASESQAPPCPEAPGLPQAGGSGGNGQTRTDTDLHGQEWPESAGGDGQAWARPDNTKGPKV